MSSYILKGAAVESAHLLQFDGGARPKRGATAGAYVLKKGNEVVAEGGRFLETGTSNMGEYTGLIAGLKKAIALEIKSIAIEGDSLLVISQMAGVWKVRDPKMQRLHAEAAELLHEFRNVVCRHVRREFNAHADSLSTQTLCLGKSWSKTL